MTVQPKQDSKSKTKELNDKPNHRILKGEGFRRGFRVIVAADSKIRLGIVSDDAVDAAPNGPAHPARRIDGPDEDGAVLRLALALELAASGPAHDVLEEIEGGVGDEEELACVGEAGADVRDGEVGKVFGTKGDVGCLLVRKFVSACAADRL